jgi:hypothetical protein
MFVFCQSPARAFIFTDASALAQRAAQFAQTAAHYVSSNNHYAQFMQYVTQFNQYRTQFEGYYNNFRSVYGRLSSADYYRDFNPSNWNWTRLDNHLVKAWRTFNQTAWEAQVITLRASRLYDSNPVYRRYADQLITLTEEQADQLKKEEAHLLELEAQDARHKEALETFRNTNASLATGTGEVPLGKQVALTNAILIELVSIQSETRIVEQRLLTMQKDQQNLIARMKELELEAQRDDAGNLEHILSRTAR